MFTAGLVDKAFHNDEAAVLAFFFWPMFLTFFVLKLPLKVGQWLIYRNDPVKRIEREIKAAELELRLEEKRERLRQIQESAFDRMLK